MHRHRRYLRLLALAVVVALPLLGMSGVASAKINSAKGCHKTHTCKNSAGGGTGTGAGAATSTITLQVDPNPVIEVSRSEVNVVVQVETSPSFAGAPVSISSSQLFASCLTVYLTAEQTTGPIPYIGSTESQDAPLTVTLDDDGNVTVEFDGINCAPGTDLIDAYMAVAPYYTALGTLTVSPPVVTTPGVYAYPTTSGTVTGGEVETGDDSTVPPPNCGDEDTCVPGGFDDSDVFAVFYVETDPVYAEQQVEINDNQLADSCGGGAYWFDAGTNPLNSADPVTTLDDDGNAVSVFWGASCAATASDVVADVLAGSHPTYTTTFTVLAPQPTI
jgi:hypothetical protein